MSDLTGRRVRITGIMPNDPDPLAIGEEGTVVEGPNRFGQIHVTWDSGRTLMLLTLDPFVVLPE